MPSMKVSILRAEEARARSQAVADPEYRLGLELAPAASYRGRVEIRFRLAAPVPGLHLDYSGREVSRLVVNGEALAPASCFDGHRIALDPSRFEEGENRVLVEFASAYDHDGAGLHEVVDPADGRHYLFTHFEPFDANRLFPCFDQPDLRAHFELEVLAPADWMVVGNGRVLSTRDQGGSRLHRFERLGTFSTYLLALAAGPFACWVDPGARVPSRLFTTQSLAPHMDSGEIFEVTRQGFDFFPGWFERPYPFPKYDQVFVPQFNIGAMENVGCVMLNADRYLYRHPPTEAERERRAETVLHEMAHMWFGDLVAIRWWDETWLKEGFASYMAFVALTRATRFRDAWATFQDRMKAWGLRQDELPSRHPILGEVPDTDVGGANFDGITYGKGAAVLKQLASWLGSETFRRGVAAFLQEFAWQAAGTAGFLKTLSRVAGRDLSGWASAWLGTSGCDELQAELEIEEGLAQSVLIRRKVASGDPADRPHRLSLAVYEDDPSGRLGPEPRRIEVVVDRETTRVEALQGTRAPALIHLDYGDHAAARVLLDPASAARCRRDFREIPDPHLRLTLFAQYGYEIRSGRRPAADLPDLFLEVAGAETRAASLAAWLEPLVSVVDLFLEDQGRDAWIPRLAALARERLEATRPGTDGDRVWFDHLVAWSRDPVRLDELAAVVARPPDPLAWLSGDPDRRHAAILRLFAHGHDRAASLLASEMERDPGERARTASLKCQAASPDPDVKERVFARFLEDREAPLDRLREAMKGFQWVHQGAVLERFASAYLEALPRISEERNRPFAKAFTSELFPWFPVTASTLAAARHLLESDAVLLPSVRRGLLEASAELEEALRSRSLG